MKRISLKKNLGVVLVAILMSGCGGGSVATPEKSNDEFKITFTKNMLDAMRSMDNRIPPNLEKLSSFVSDDKEEQYYYNLLSNFIHNKSKIAVVKETKKVSNELLRAEYKKAFPSLSDESLDAMVKSEAKNYSNKQIEQTTLKELPEGATSSSVKLDSKDDNRNGIIIIYSFDSKEQAKNKMNSLEPKLRNFLSHDKLWGVGNAAGLEDVKNQVLTDKNKSKLIKKIEAEIKEAEKRGEDTTNLKVGLEKLKYNQNDGNDILSFTYSWRLNNKDVFFVTAINFSVNKNKLTATIFKQINK